MSRLAAATILLVALLAFFIEAASFDEGPDECLHAGTAAQCAQAHNHR